jgi:hypothetical protein
VIRNARKRVAALDTIEKLIPVLPHKGFETEAGFGFRRTPV